MKAIFDLIYQVNQYADEENFLQATQALDILLRNKDALRVFLAFRKSLKEICEKKNIAPTQARPDREFAPSRKLKKSIIGGAYLAALDESINQEDIKNILRNPQCLLQIANEIERRENKVSLWKRFVEMVCFVVKGVANTICSVGQGVINVICTAYTVVTGAFYTTCTAVTVPFYTVISWGPRLRFVRLMMAAVLVLSIGIGTLIIYRELYPRPIPPIQVRLSVPIIMADFKTSIQAQGEERLRELKDPTPELSSIVENLVKFKTAQLDRAEPVLVKTCDLKLSDLPQTIDFSCEQATLLYCVKMLQERGYSGCKTILPINGLLLPPSHRDKDWERNSYFYSQTAVEKVRDLFRIPDEIYVNSKLRQTLAESLAKKPQEALASLSLPKEIKQLLVIKVTPNTTDMSKGTISFSLFNIESQQWETENKLPFSGSRPLIDFLSAFPDKDTGVFAIEFADGESEDEFGIIFKPSQIDKAFVFFDHNPDGLPIEEKNFAGSELAELCFETYLECNDKQEPRPKIQFATGGEKVMQTALKAQYLGANWHHVAIPVNIAKATHWKRGLTVTAFGISKDSSLKVYIRNAYIRVLESKNDDKQAKNTPSETSLVEQNTTKNTVENKYYVYDEKIYNFPPGTWMPDGAIEISQDLENENNPYQDKFCYHVNINLEKNDWVAVAFLAGGTLEPVATVDVFEALKAKPGDSIVLTFYARSMNNSVLQFKVGGFPKDSIKFAAKTDWIQLDPTWKQISIDLTGKDLSAVRAALIWVIDRKHNKTYKDRKPEFDLDEIYFTKVR
jgi:hypothetical protein